jgi:lysophospholipase L1-like esterase
MNFLARVLFCLAVSATMCRAEGQGFKFSLSGDAPEGFLRIDGTPTFEEGRGWGFTATNAPLKFAVRVPEGNYIVRLRIGSSVAGKTTVKAQNRQLVVPPVETKAGESIGRAFAVNVRTRALKEGGAVRINSRELGPPVMPRWDNRIVLELDGAEASVSRIEISPAAAIPTIFIAGDSTVTDQDHDPWTGWGQMLPAFFTDKAAIANHAESGLSLASFLSQKRLDKILESAKKGDYVFVQFGHNDQKIKGDAIGIYKRNLARLIDAVRKTGATPVVVTSMERRHWEHGSLVPTLSEFAAAATAVAKEKGAAVIDLHAMSIRLYKALGEERSKTLFVHFPAGTFPQQGKALADNTHHCMFGGYELARCVVEGIRAGLPELAKDLSPDAGPFDPGHPDDPAGFAIPMSALSPVVKPAGS